MQALPHLIVPAGHAHVPFAQLAPVGQADPQAPQFKLSFRVSTQRLPHCVCAQLELHVPFEQKPALGGHALPQVPQFCGSLCRITHESPHAWYGLMQAHCPAWQNWPCAQGRPQAPQLNTSVCVSPQSSSPLGASLAHATATAVGAIADTTNDTKLERLRADIGKTPRVRRAPRHWMRQ
jgi:hypothetical protein